MCFSTMSWKKGAFFILFVSLFLNGCVLDKGNDIPNVSDINIDLKFQRFEKDLFALDTTSIASSLQNLEQNYPAFSKIFFENILRSKDSRIAPEGHETYISGFISHPAVRHLYDTTMVLFPNMDAFEKDFEKAFQYLKYYFPDQPTPDVTTFLSEYTIGAFIYEDNKLACGLDFFLGESFPYSQYNPQNPNFSGYITRTFNKDHLVAKTLQPLVNDLVGPTRGNRLLDHMIHNGKKLYIMDKLLPHHPDSIIMEVTGPQVEWLEENEREMWAYFLSENLLYSSEWQNIRKLVEYSPHSPGMPPEAPGRTANWVGWQIVKFYMDKVPNQTMADLIALKDAQTLMDKSRYKPKR